MWCKLSSSRYKCLLCAKTVGLTQGWMATCLGGDYDDTAVARIHWNVANKQYVAKEDAYSLVGILCLSPSRGESCK